MPSEDGFAVCRHIRAETDAPILFLTARTDEPSVLTGLGLGADDYPDQAVPQRSCVRGSQHTCGGRTAHTIPA